MKNIILAATLALVAMPAMASKSRLSALSHSAHLSDIRDSLVNPAKLTAYNDWVTFEMGRTSSSISNYTPNAEGGFARSMGEARYGFFLGNTPAWVTEFRTNGSYLTAENPITLNYAGKAGDMAWGVGLLYSNSDRKSTKTKQSATGINAGVATANWDAFINLGLTNSYKNETTGSEADFKGSGAMSLGGTYTMDSMTIFAQMDSNGGKNTNAAGTETFNKKSSTNQVGVVNSHKKDGTDFFYGVALQMSESKDSVADTKTTSTKLPVWMGVEADATSWMVMRASVSQNVLLGSEKTTTGGTGEADTIANNTTVAAGLGLKFNKFTLDGTLSAANDTNAELNGNKFLANAALTYMF